MGKSKKKLKVLAQIGQTNYRKKNKDRHNYSKQKLKKIKTTQRKKFSMMICFKKLGFKNNNFKIPKNK